MIVVPRELEVRM